MSQHGQLFKQTYPAEIAKAYESVDLDQNVAKDCHVALLDLGKALVHHLWKILRSEYVDYRRTRVLESVETVLQEKYSKKPNITLGDRSILTTTTWKALEGLPDGSLVSVGSGANPERAGLLGSCAAWRAIRGLWQEHEGDTSRTPYGEVLERAASLGEEQDTSIEGFLTWFVNCRNAWSHQKDGFSRKSHPSVVLDLTTEVCAISPALRGALDELLLELA